MAKTIKKPVQKRRDILGELDGKRIPKSVYGERKRASVKHQLFLKDCDYIADGQYDVVPGGLPR